MSARAEGSLTDRVVAELAAHLPLLPCCRTSLVEGMRLVAAPGGAPIGATAAPSDGAVVLLTSRRVAARVALGALHADSRSARVERRRTPRRPSYAILGEVATPGPGVGERVCCARSALRGAVLAGGSLSRPDRPPHLELTAVDEASACRLLALLGRLGIDATVAQRRGRTVVAVRTIDGVASVLSSVGAQDGRLRFEEGRVVREVRAGVNRRLNAETANLRRMVRAGVRQVRAAERLQRDTDGWSRLTRGVREAALLRCRHPQDSLVRLAERAGVGRSTMAARLRRLLLLGGEGGVGV